MQTRAIFYTLILSISLCLFITSCKPKNSNYAEVMHNPFLYEKIVHDLNYVIIYDIFTPPVASRIFACSNLAAFEVLAKEGKHFNSLTRKVKDLNNIPNPPKGTKIDYPFASLIALIKVGDALTFSSDTMKVYC